MSRLKILIVEDEEPVRELLVDYFSESHHECKDAESGEKALEIMPEFKPHIVITDFKMPDMNGIELLRQIREQNFNTRVIILTGFPDQQNAIDAVNFGAQAFLQKPINLGDISDIVEKIYSEVAKELGERNSSQVDVEERSRLKVSVSALEHFQKKYYSM